MAFTWILILGFLRSLFLAIWTFELWLKRVCGRKLDLSNYVHMIFNFLTMQSPLKTIKPLQTLNKSSMTMENSSIAKKPYKIYYKRDFKFKKIKVFKINCKSSLIIQQLGWLKNRKSIGNLPKIAIKHHHDLVPKIA